MSVIQQIQDMLPEFSKSERKLADHILKYPYDLKRASGIAISEICGVSRSAVIRFCQKLGFRGFADFKEAMLNEPETMLHLSIKENHTVLDIYASCVEQMKSIDPDILNNIASIIRNSSRVICYGELHSSYSAKQMAFRLNRNNVAAAHTSDFGIFENHIDFLNSQDAAIIFSLSGQKKFAETMKKFRKKGVKVILFTTNPKTVLVSDADATLVLPSATYSDSPFLLDDAICFFLGIEMVIEAINRL